MAERSRRYGWIPIEAVGPPLAGRTGLAYFQGLRDGTIPAQPIAATIGWRVVEAELGRVRFAVTPAEHLFHGGGMVHGGVLATLLDGACAGAVMSTLPENALCASLALNVQYLNAVREPHDLFATGDITHRASRIATAEVRLEDASGKLYARATATLMITLGRDG